MQAQGTTELSRSGRTRQSGARYQNGRLKPKDDVMAVVLAQPHRRGRKVVKDSNGRVLTDLRRDQRAESSLGRLNLDGRITDQQYSAGKTFAKVVTRYRAVISAPDPLLQPVPGSGAELPADEAKRRKAAYDAAFIALGEAGQKAQRAVSKVAVYDHQLSWPDITLEHLVCGLSTLVKFFGLTAGGKSGPLHK